MSDENKSGNSNENDKDAENDASHDDSSPGAFLPKPIITAPVVTVVSRRFNVHAITSPQPHSKWNLDFFRVGQSSRLVRYDGGVGIGFIEFVVPDELPVGVDIFFMIEYRDLASTIYSPWATSHVFRIQRDPTPVPVIGAPTEGFSHVGPGQLNGTCLAGATVRVKFINGDPSEADAHVNGTSWAYNYSWNPGTHQFQVQQTVNGQPSAWTGIRKFYIKPSPPRIDNPMQGSNVPVDSAVYGAFTPGATVVVQDSTGKPIAGTFIYTTGGWIFSYPWVPGEKHIKAVQTMNGQTSLPSDLRQFRLRPHTLVIQPPPVPAAAKQPLTLTGVSSGAVTLNMWNDANTAVAGNFTGTGATRTFTPTANWLAGTTKVKATQSVNNVGSYPSEPVTLRVKPLAPQITTPKEGETHLAVEVQGTCEPGATVKVWSGGTDLGAAPVNGTSWTNRWPWTPGPKVVQARQTVAEQDSPDTEVINFKIKAPKPTISPPPNPAAAKQVLNITGVWSGNVALQMLTEAGAPVAGSFSSSGTTRTFAPTANWALGSTLVKVVQTVNTVDSDPSEPVTLWVKPLAPQITTPKEGETHLAVEVQGTCEPGATVKVWSDGTDLGAAPVNGTSWTNRWPWTPGPKVVHARQTVAGHSSPDSAVINFKIKPPQPTISPPPNPAAAKQVLNITGVWSGNVALQMLTEAGAPVAGSFSASGTTRTFTPTANWALGSTLVKVVQTVNTVDSDPSEPVTLRVKPLAPKITTPKEGETHLAVEVQGTCEPGATVKVWSGETDLGAAPVNGTSWTNRWLWTPGPKAVHAWQTVAGHQSPDSAVINFKIKAPKPTISPPPNPAAAKQVLTITGVWFGSLLTPQMQMLTEAGTPVAGNFSASGTTRTFTPTANWAFGTTTVKVVQTVNGVASDPSNLVSVVVKPLAPQITNPKEGETHLAVEVQGICEPGATVKVWSGVTDLGATEVVGTNWTNRWAWTPGLQVVHARQTVAGHPSPDSAVINFKIKPPQPAISPPPNPAAADETLTITEVWSGDVTLQMLTGENAPVAGTFTGSGTTRTFTPTADWADENTVKVVQTVNTVDSDPSDDCTFTVEVGEKPEAPHFERPLASGKTSTRPLIRAVGLPHALLTVQLDGAETLHSDSADADGILEFTVETSLTPGETALRVNQKAGGPVSDWSEPHRFTVKELPKTPIIDAPLNTELVPRKPTIRGRGETRGEIRLRHADESKEMIATLNGVTSWRWTAKEAWPLGNYTIEAQQAEDEDSSEWSETRSFEVVDALFGIGDATPVIGNPVVGSGQSVMLRVQVLSGDTGEAAEGVTVQWRLKGQEDVLATTVTEQDGWAYYAYTPETVGKSEVVADITNDNAGVVMTQLYEVNARLQDEWANEVWLYLHGQPVDLASSDLVLVPGKTSTLQLSLQDGNQLWGTDVTLQDMWGAVEGLTVVPALGTPQKVEAPMMSWSISLAEGQRGIFGLRLTSPMLSDWQLPGRVLTEDFAQSVDVDLDTYPQVFGGEAAHPCLGATHSITVRPKPDSPMLGQHVLLELTPEAADLGVTVRPPSQRMTENGVRWSLNCVKSSKSGNFAVRLALQVWGIKSPEMPISLGHNKVEITERDGPRRIDERWRYGIRVTSAFSGQPAGDVAVTVTLSGSGDVQRSTQSDGWIYVYYDDGQDVSFTIHNGYDGSTIHD